MLPLSDINEMPQKIPNDLIGKDLIHETTSNAHESIMKSSVLIADSSLHKLTACAQPEGYPQVKKKNEEESISTLFLRRCKMQVHSL